MGKPTSVIEFAEKRLAEEVRQNELGQDMGKNNTDDIRYWVAYLDGARAQAKENGRESNGVKSIGGEKKSLHITSLKRSVLLQKGNANPSPAREFF